MSNNRTDIILLTNYYWLTAEDGTSMAHVFCGLIDKLSSVRCNMNTASDLLLSLFDLTFTVWWRDGGLLAWTVRPHAFAATDGLCHDLGAGPSTPPPPTPPPETGLCSQCQMSPSGIIKKKLCYDVIEKIPSRMTSLDFFASQAAL